MVKVQWRGVMSPEIWCVTLTKHSNIAAIINIDPGVVLMNPQIISCVFIGFMALNVDFPNEATITCGSQRHKAINPPKLSSRFLSSAGGDKTFGKVSFYCLLVIFSCVTFCRSKKCVWF